MSSRVYKSSPWWWLCWTETYIDQQTDTRMFDSWGLVTDSVTVSESLLKWLKFTQIEEVDIASLQSWMTVWWAWMAVSIRELKNVSVCVCVCVRGVFTLVKMCVVIHSGGEIKICQNNQDKYSLQVCRQVCACVRVSSSACVFVSIWFPHTCSVKISMPV